MKIKGRYIAVMLVLAAILAAAAAVWWWLRPPLVEVAPVTRGDAAEIVYATGTVEPRHWAKVAPLMRERIVWLCNCESQEVAQGAELARLDDREARAALDELRARQAFTARELQRLRDLADRNVASRQDLERSESEEARIEAQIAAQQARLEGYILRSPMGGTVLRQDGEVGEIAEPGAPLFHVGQPQPLRILAEINEEDIPRLSVGQRALLRSDAFPSAALEARLDSITPMGDPAARTYRVRLALPGDTPLLIGMTVEVNIVTRLHKDALLVPAEAVSADGMVWVLEAAKTRRVPVVLGIRGADMAEVLDGLTPGQQLIVPVPEGLSDGAAVRTGAAP
ncbi:efflux RND transporter periplasmic adaptor subunit [Paracoccus sp. T5]